MPTNLGFSFLPSRDYGSDWASYFREYTSQLAEFKSGFNHDAEVTAPIVTEPGHEIPLSELCKQASEVAALLTAQGRTVSARRSGATIRGVPFKTGARAGEMRPDKSVTCHSIATVDRKDPVVTANWIDNKLDFARIGWHDGRRTYVTLVTTLKNLIKTEVADEENPDYG